MREMKGRVNPSHKGPEGGYDDTNLARSPGRGRKGKFFRMLPSLPARILFLAGEDEKLYESQEYDNTIR